MISGICDIQLGSAIVFWSPYLLGFAAVFWLIMHTMIVKFEEPQLRQTFGQPYVDYCMAVPRWIPRFTPYQSSEQGNVASAAEDSNERSRLL